MPVVLVWQTPDVACTAPIQHMRAGDCGTAEARFARSQMAVRLVSWQTVLG